MRREGFVVEEIKNQSCGNLVVTLKMGTVYQPCLYAQDLNDTV
jgi:hypothetical protein